MTTIDPVGARTTHPVLVRAGAALGAAVAGLAAWALLTGPLGLELTARIGADVSGVGPAAIAVSALIAGLGGWGVAQIIERLAAQPRRRWRHFAVVVAVVSLGGPLTSAEGTESVIGLGLLHVVTALTVIPTVAATLPAKRERRTA